MSDQSGEVGQPEVKNLRRREFLHVTGAATAGAVLGGEGRATATEGRSEELAVLDIVIELQPHLSTIASILRRARERNLQYPIDRRRQLLLLADGRIEATFGDVTLNYHNSIRFVPTEFFPISSERDFAKKLYLAFTRGDVAHAMEDRRQSISVTHGSEVTLLPSPRPLTNEAID
jgi:hypothetical protein